MRNKFIFMMLMTSLLFFIGCTDGPHSLEKECEYGPKATKFCFWSDRANQMEVCIYESADALEGTKYPLRKLNDDFWVTKVKGDLKGKFYTVRSEQNGEWSEEVPGIFAKAVNVNGTRAAIIDMAETDPEGWSEDVRPEMKDMTDVVVYETHIRDYTMSPNSGIENKGKFIAFCEDGTITSDGLASGIDHLKELGITHIQILPMFDYGSIDETQLDKNGYNWGYDPINYNVPEGGYSTDPYSPTQRILEMKKMIQAFHKAGIRVIMDVVYNHTYNVFGCSLGRVVPEYFYRFNEDGSYANGSGCGNETASDHEMMRRFMVESVCYWAREYHIDGFRFDLMGIHDQETMLAIKRKLDMLDESIIVYGEGWAAMKPQYDYDKLAMKEFMYKMPTVGAFSDDIRNALIGSPFDHERGFASGNPTDWKNVAFGLVGAIDFRKYDKSVFEHHWTAYPMQHISYVTCHDNYCLRDRIAVSAPKESEETQLRMNKLAQTAVMVSQGMAFIYGGEELFRTKQGIDNSFQSPDSINIIPWENKLKYADLFEYYKQIIAIRRAHKGFRLGNPKFINYAVDFLPTRKMSTIIYSIRDIFDYDTAPSLVVVLNGSDQEDVVDLPFGNYTILAEDGRANVEGIRDFTGEQLTVFPYSATILAEKVIIEE